MNVPNFSIGLSVTVDIGFSLFEKNLLCLYRGRSLLLWRLLCPKALGHRSCCHQVGRYRLQSIGLQRMSSRPTPRFAPSRALDIDQSIVRLNRKVKVLNLDVLRCGFGTVAR